MTETTFTPDQIERMARADQLSLQAFDARLHGIVDGPSYRAFRTAWRALRAQLAREVREKRTLMRCIRGQDPESIDQRGEAQFRREMLRQRLRRLHALRAAVDGGKPGHARAA